MALITCKECKEKVSATAKTCPKCGATMKKRTSVLTWIIAIIFALIVFGIVRAPSNNGSTSAATVTATDATVVPHWETTSSTDKMTGTTQFYATSPSTGPLKKMGFPYGDVESWLGVGCDGRSEWAYVGFNKAPNLTDIETEDGYNSINTRMKWGQSIEEVALSQKWGAAFLQFDHGAAAISNMDSSSAALLELSWYGQEHPYFQFPMTGAHAAIEKMRKECSSIGSD